MSPRLWPQRLPSAHAPFVMAGSHEGMGTGMKRAAHATVLTKLRCRRERPRSRWRPQTPNVPPPPHSIHGLSTGWWTRASLLPRNWTPATHCFGCPAHTRGILRLIAASPSPGRRKQYAPWPRANGFAHLFPLRREGAHQSPGNATRSRALQPASRPWRWEGRCPPRLLTSRSRVPQLRPSLPGRPAGRQARAGPDLGGGRR